MIAATPPVALPQHMAVPTSTAANDAGNRFATLLTTISEPCGETTAGGAADDATDEPDRGDAQDAGAALAAALAVVAPINVELTGAAPAGAGAASVALGRAAPADAPGSTASEAAAACTGSVPGTGPLGATPREQRGAIVADIRDHPFARLANAALRRAASQVADTPLAMPVTPLTLGDRHARDATMALDARSLPPGDQDAPGASPVVAIAPAMTDTAASLAQAAPGPPVFAAIAAATRVMGAVHRDWIAAIGDVVARAPIAADAALRVHLATGAAETMVVAARGIALDVRVADDAARDRVEAARPLIAAAADRIATPAPQTTVDVGDHHQRAPAPPPRPRIEAGIPSDVVPDAHAPTPSRRRDQRFA